MPSVTLHDSLEVLKIVGGIGGILSSVFLVYDRVVRLRPLVYLHLGDFRVDLRVKNAANEPIIIDEIAVSPPVLGVAMANDLMSTIQAVAARWYPRMAPEKASRTFAVIGPLQERSFGLVLLDEFDKLKDDERIRIRCEWRSTRRPFPFRRSAIVRTTVRDIRLLKEAAIAKKS
ncbi:MAG TPA: hypothetical protein VIG34_11010 [Xanthobacteraceae bacterium]|jgi:hypothetical protein